MAQIIKHRRGSLESISGATKRAGELLVVTGSTGISATNGDSILFVGVDGSTATPANKVLQGATNPDLSGASYDTSIDGIPFYNTETEKLYILNKGGNVEIKATANTGGTGIVSGSSQVKELLPAGSISGSSQVDITSAQGYTSLESRVTTNENNISTNTSNISDIFNDISSIQTAQGVQDGRLDSLESFETAQGITNDSVSSDLSGLFAGQNTQDGRLTSLESFSSSLDASFVNETQLSNLSSSVNGNVVELFASASDHEGRIDTIEASIGGASGIGQRVSSLEAFSGSQESKDATLASYTGSVNEHIDAINSFSSSQLAKDATLATYTGSVDAHISAVNSFSASQLAKDSTLASYTGSVDAHISAVNAFSASQLSKDSTLASYTGSVDTSIQNINTKNDDQDNRLDSLESRADSTDTAQGVQDGRLTDLEGRATDLETFQSDVETAISFDGQNVSINGNFTVSGTQTVVNSTTIQLDDNIIELNGSGVANGGLLVKDATGATTISGSLLWDSTNDYWKAGGQAGESKILLAGGDSVVSGSSQINLADVTGNNTSNVSEGDNLYFTDARVKTKLNAENVISGSSQVTISSTTGYTAFSSSLAAADAELFSSASNHEGRIDTIEASIGGASGIGQRVSSLEAFSGSQESKDATLATYTGSVDAHIDAINSFSASQLSKDSTLASYTSSVDAHISAVNAFSASQLAKDSALATYTGSVDAQLSDIASAQGVQDGRLSDLEAFSSSLDAGFVNETQLTNAINGVNDTINALSTDNIAEGDNLYFTDARVKTKLNAENVISGSSQVNADSITNFDANVKDKMNLDNVVSGSAQIKALLPTGTISGSSQLDNTTIANATLTGVTADGTFNGTFVGDGSGLTGLVTELGLAGDTGTGNVDLLTQTLSVEGGEGIDVSVSGTTITIAAEDASSSNKGVASFVADDFSVTSGVVSIKDGGVRAMNLNADVVGEGLSLDGTDNSINVDYGSSAGTAVEGNTSLEVQGTTGEISITGGNVTLGAGGTITIGLPDDVTISNSLTVNGDVVLGNSQSDSVTIAGNLFVQGTTTTVDSTTIQLGDNIIELNGSGAANGGLLVKDATNPNTASGSFLWDSTNDYWKAGALGLEKEVARIDSSISTNTVLKSDANGLLVNTTITDDGTDVSITGDFTIGGLSAANAFLYADGSKTLQSVAPTQAGDMIQWNGSSFVASNTVDGGTF
jgi:hypothetical protein